MREEFSEYLIYATGALGYKWIAIVMAWIICIGGWSFIFVMPDKYESTARVQVDSVNMLQPLLRGMAVQYDLTAMTRLMQQLMFTRPKLEQIIKLSDLETLDDQSKHSYENLLSDLKKNIKITGGNKDLFEISYEATNPNMAKKVVHAVLTVFSEQTLQNSTSDTDKAIRFIEEQVDEYETRLKNAEKAKEEFKRVNLDFLPEKGEQSTVLYQLKDKLDSATVNLRQAISRRDVLAAQMKSAIETDEEWGITDFSNISPEDSRIESLKTKKTELLLKYTDVHPEILAIDNVIASLEKQKKENQSSAPEELFASGKMSNPYVQTLKIALDNAEAEVASNQSLAVSIQEKINQVNKEMSERLRVATEMEGLNRDYDTIKSQYLELLERREQARITQKADDNSSGLSFKIADPPNTPLRPSSPNRLLLYSIVFFSGIISGIFTSFAIAFLKPTYMSVQQVRLITGLPVLGGISMADENIQNIAENKWLSSVVLLSLLFIYLGFMTKELISAGILL
jgi:polysaccharide chain length determinant protein (PEP-CTERM system associated)